MVKCKCEKTNIRDLKVGDNIYIVDDDEFGIVINIGTTLLHGHYYIKVAVCDYLYNETENIKCYEHENKEYQKVLMVWGTKQNGKNNNGR